MLGEGRSQPTLPTVLGELDLYLFNEGTHRRLWKVLGPQVLESGVSFAVWAPNARNVWVVGDFDDWHLGSNPLVPQGSSGIWYGVVEHAVPGHRYKLAVEDPWGNISWRADPMARQSECPPSNASVVPDPASFGWSDADWRRERDAAPATQRPLRIYELHLGSWRPGADGTSYRDVAPALADHVRRLGFTHVELMPLAEHPFGGSWGYQVSGYFAPTARYGSPADLKFLIDTLHAHGIGVILDWVPAHFPRDDWALARFDGTALYEHADPRLGEHPDWGTLVFNYGRHEVRSFLLSNALYWFDEFHVDGLRVDAVASMLYLDYSREPHQWVPNRYGGRENLDAIALLRQVNAAVFAEHPGALMIAEESTAWPGVSHPVDSGGLGFSHKWNMGWMHDTLAYFARDPVHRKHHHHELTFGLLYAFSETFVLPLSHDEVVHGKGSLLAKMSGDDWQRFANLRALYGWMWAHPGAPLVFMGAELAPWAEWNEAEGLPWHLLDDAPHRGVRDLVATLNGLAGEWESLWRRDRDPMGFQWLDADDADTSCYAFLRWGNDGKEAVACIANLTPVPRTGYRVGLPWDGGWQVLLDTDRPEFGGSGFLGDRQHVEADTSVPWQGQPASMVIDLPPLSVIWLGARR
jgi:1,4-alpha-glucan branching enzyme